MTLPAPPIFEPRAYETSNSKITHFQARLLLAIGKWSKLIPDIMVYLSKNVPQMPFSRTRIYENLLILSGKSMIQEGAYGWTSSLTGKELEKLNAEVENYEKNIQSHSNDTGNTGGV